MEEFMTALIHLTHSICSRASEKCLVPDKHERLSSKQFIPPRTRNSLSHSLFAFSKRRGLIPEKFFSDGVFNNLTHNSGSASAISSVFGKETSLFSLEIFRHMDFALKAILQFPLTFQHTGARQRHPFSVDARYVGESPRKSCALSRKQLLEQCRKCTNKSED